MLALILSLAPNRAAAQELQGTMFSPAASLSAEALQLTFDVIQSRVNALMQSNEQLNEEFDYIRKQEAQVQTAIKERANDNDIMRQFLKERNGRTDQQIKIDELTELVRQKKLKVMALNQQAAQVKIQLASLDRDVALKKMKMEDHLLREKQRAMPRPAVVRPAEPPAPSQELIDLSRQLQEQKNIEEVLRQRAAAPLQAYVRPEVKALQDRLESLRKRKAELLSRKIDRPKEADAGRYEVMMQRKSQLEEQIKSFEARINGFKDASTRGLARGPVSKQLVHEVVQADTRNAKLRAAVANVREDISILQLQISRLEKRQMFSAGKN